MNEKIDITLRIADRALSMNISPEDETDLRQAAKEVNHAWQTWRKRFEGRDNQEILAMVTLLFAKAFVSLREENSRLAAVLEDFDNNLDTVLSLADPTSPPDGTDTGGLFQ